MLLHNIGRQIVETKHTASLDLEWVVIILTLTHMLLCHFNEVQYLCHLSHYVSMRVLL